MNKEPQNTIEQNQTEEVVAMAQESVLQTTKPLRRANWFDLLAVILIFFTAQVIGAMILQTLGIVPPMRELLTSANAEVAAAAQYSQAEFTAIAFFSGMFLAVVVIILYFRLRRVRVNVRFYRRGTLAPLKILCGYLLLWSFSITSEPLAELLPSQSVVLGSGVWLLVTTVLFAPFFEELLFRGYIAGVLRERYGAMLAWLLSSLLFGLAHGSPSMLISATLSGLILGYYYMRYGSLLQVIMLHAMNNATVCFMMSIGVAEKSIRELVSSDTTYWTIYAISAIATVVAIVVMWSRLRKKYSRNIPTK